MITNISFNGIYLIKFPKSYSDKQIKSEQTKIINHIEKKNYWYMSAQFRQGIPPQKANQSNSDILLTTNIDNPNQIYDILSVINKDLADQYFDKTKVYLDVQA